MRELYTESSKYVDVLAYVKKKQYLCIVIEKSMAACRGFFM